MSRPFPKLLSGAAIAILSLISCVTSPVTPEAVNPAEVREGVPSGIRTEAVEQAAEEAAEEVVDETAEETAKEVVEEVVEEAPEEVPEGTAEEATEEAPEEATEEASAGVDVQITGRKPADRSAVTPKGPDSGIQTQPDVPGRSALPGGVSPDPVVPETGTGGKIPFRKPVQESPARIMEGTTVPGPAAASAVPENPLLGVDRPWTPPGDEPGTATAAAPSAAAAPPHADRLSPAVTSSPSTEPTPTRTPAPVTPSASTGNGSFTASRTTSEPGVAPAPDIPGNARSAAAPTRILETPGEISITLSGTGWIFRSDLSTPGSWSFAARERNGDATIFRFLFIEPGNWNLVFERQDSGSGMSEQIIRHVVVEGDGRTSVASHGSAAHPDGRMIPGTLPDNADARHQAALDALAQNRISDAIELWERDARSGGDDGRRAVEGIVSTAAEYGSMDLLVGWIGPYLDDDPNPDTLAQVLDAFDVQAGYAGEKQKVLESLTVIDAGHRQPEWLFRLAGELEQPGPGRDLDRSAALYREVIDRWPLSPWRVPSEERLEWLQRHYFRVR